MNGRTTKKAITALALVGVLVIGGTAIALTRDSGKKTDPKSPSSTSLTATSESTTPDGKPSIATGVDGRLVLVDRDTNQLVIEQAGVSTKRLKPELAAYPDYVTPSSDSNKLLGYAEGGVTSIDLSSGKLDDVAQGYRPVLSPDQKWFAYTEDKEETGQTLIIKNLSSGKTYKRPITGVDDDGSRNLQGGAPTFDAVAWEPNGDQLVLQRYNEAPDHTSLTLLNPTTNKETPLCSLALGWTVVARLSDGAFLVQGEDTLGVTGANNCDVTLLPKLNTNDDVKVDDGGYFGSDRGHIAVRISDSTSEDGTTYQGFVLAPDGKVWNKLPGDDQYLAGFLPAS